MSKEHSIKKSIKMKVEETHEEKASHERNEDDVNVNKKRSSLEVVKEIEQELLNIQKECEKFSSPKITNDISTNDDGQATMKEATEIHLVKHLMKVNTNPSTKQLSKFVNRLSQVIATINKLEGVKIMYKLSNEMTETVKNNLNELEFLSMEMKALLNNLYRLKKKRFFIHKEKEGLKETRANIKREEVQEMETVVAIYDKDLLRTWHTAKKTTSIQSLENFIIHLKGKKQAMEYVFQLATDKLISMKNKLEKQPKKTIVRALPPPSSDSERDSIFSTD